MISFSFDLGKCSMSSNDSKFLGDNSKVAGIDLRFLIDSYKKRKLVAGTNTHRSYSASLRSFYKFLTEELEIHQPIWADVNEANVTRWIISLTSTRAPATVNNRLAAVTSMAGKVSSYFQISNPVASVKGVTGETPVPRSVEDEVVELLRKEIQQISGCPNKVAKYVLILELSLALGLRAEEIRSVRLSNIDNVLNEVSILGKGRKARKLPIPEEVRSAIHRYLPVREKLLEPHSIGSSSDLHACPNMPLLISTRLASSSKPESYRVSYSSISRMFGRLENRVGHNVTCHMMRHTFAKRLEMKSRNISLVMYALGHTNIQTTMRYLNCNASDLKKILG